MEETICSVEFVRDADVFIARVQSELGGLREFRAGSIEEVLEQVILELQEEFENISEYYYPQEPEEE
jgi:lipoate-protein ligase A